MATSAPPAPTASPAASVAVLKQVKATEAEWATKVADARRASESTLGRLRGESDEAVRAAKAGAEDDRTRALARVQTDVETEVAQILEEGERAAAAAGRTTGKRPQDRRERVLAVVLGPFAES